MTPDTDRGLTLLTARWLALGAAAGVAELRGIDQAQQLVGQRDILQELLIRHDLCSRASVME